MEGTHGQLGARLTDGLCCNHTDSFTDTYRCAVGQIAAVTVRTYTVFSFTGQHGTDTHRFNHGIFNLLGQLFVDHGACRCNFSAGDRITCSINQYTTENTFVQWLDHFTTLNQGREEYAVFSAAILNANHSILCNVHQTAGQVT